MNKIESGKGGHGHLMELVNALFAQGISTFLQPILASPYEVDASGLKTLS